MPTKSKPASNAVYAKPATVAPTSSGYTVAKIPNAEIANKHIIGGQRLGPGGDGSQFVDSVIKFKMTLPPHSLATRPEYQKLFEVYSNSGSNGFNDGNSFILYALMKEVSESVEHAITMKRTKGGYLENHWGPRPSVIQASGQVGLFLSSVGITPYQVEDPDGHTETVLYWDPTSSTVMLSKGIPQANNSNFFNQNLEKLANTGIQTLGGLIGGKAGNLLSTVNASGFLGKNQNAPSRPTVNASQAASTGTNLAFRNFRLLLDLFKHNGVLLDTIPNVAIHPSTFTAKEYYTKPDGRLAVVPSLAESTAAMTPAALLSMHKSSNIAPGNVLTVLPIEMWVKNTKYTGYFQNFNYSFSEDNPYIAFYDFTFVAKKTERTAVFFNSGTGGRRPFSSVSTSLSK